MSLREMTVPTFDDDGNEMAPIHAYLDEEGEITIDIGPDDDGRTRLHDEDAQLLAYFLLSCTASKVRAAALS